MSRIQVCRSPSRAITGFTVVSDAIQEYVENGNFVPAGRMRDTSRGGGDGGEGAIDHYMSVRWGTSPKMLRTADLEYHRFFLVV